MIEVATIPGGLDADLLCPRGSHDHCDAIWRALSLLPALAVLAPDPGASCPDVSQQTASEPPAPETPGKTGQVDLAAFGGAD